jgi:hypothetical protein
VSPAIVRTGRARAASHARSNGHSYGTSLV